LIFTRVGTYVQRGSKFCFVVVVVLLVVVLADTLIRILHYCTISPCFQHFAPLHAALPGSLAREPCPAALPGSLVRQPCPAALLGSLARQPCPAVRPISTGFDARARLLCSHRTVLQWQVTKLHARAAVLTDLNLFLVQFHHAFTGSLLLFPQFKDVAMLSLVYELISTCERG
jgi:hypothetical protein